MDIGTIKDALNTKVYIDQTVRDTLLEFFSIRNLKRDSSDKTILCLLAPPGMGKRTLIKSLCSALSWNLIRIPIGASKNGDGTVVGNRRSDLNAIAGRIVHALSDICPSETMVVLEDLHQLDSSLLSNPSVNFFEVINHVQNFAIKNNYQQTPVDFSQIYFFATARNLSAIPPGLLEQMEIVTIPGYTEGQKIRIAEQFILPELMKNCGLEDKLVISENALVDIVRNYTREAGVTALKHHLNKICKTAARRIYEEKNIVRIYRNNLVKYLGPQRFSFYENNGNNEIGLVKVLGRSDRGGCVVLLEVLFLSGEGQLVVTGNTDKIFQESVKVARDYVRSCAAEFGIEQDFYKKYDIHVHMLQGSTPKYGVSAGIAIVTALVSALSGKPVKGDVGMTGEISLYGKVFGVRDIRDKVLGASQAGINTIFLPRENERDLLSIPKETQRRVTIHLVDNLPAVLKEAIVWE